MLFDVYGFHSWQQYSKSRLASGLLSYISNIVIFLTWAVLLILLVLCCRYHMICRLWQFLVPVLFYIEEVQTCWHWTSYLFYLPRCTVFLNHFVASRGGGLPHFISRSILVSSAKHDTVEFVNSFFISDIYVKNVIVAILNHVLFWRRLASWCRHYCLHMTQNWAFEAEFGGVA